MPPQSRGSITRSPEPTRTPNPAALRRRSATQAYLLAKYGELGRFHEACWELSRMHDCEPGRYREITGSDFLPQAETLYRYWKQIPLKRRRAAKQRYVRP